MSGWKEEEGEETRAALCLGVVKAGFSRLIKTPAYGGRKEMLQKMPQSPFVEKSSEFKKLG